MSKAFHTIAGVIGMKHTGSGLAIVVLHDTKANNYETWRVNASDVGEFIADLDDWNAAGLYIRATRIHPHEDWSKYRDEFVSEPAASKFAKRQAHGYVESHGMRIIANCGYDANIAVSISDQPDQAAISNEEKDADKPEPPKPTGRFSGADEDFASRFARKAVEEAADAIPRPEKVAELMGAPEDHLPKPIRLEAPSTSGGKFWEVEVVHEMGRVDSDGNAVPDWHVDVTFGRLGDPGQTSNVAHRRSKASAMSVRSDRIANKRAKGYRQVAYGGA